MGVFADHVLPHLVHWVLGGKPFDRLREQVVTGLSGTVLEVGFGSGLNLPHYSRGVEKLWAVEPAAGARRLARKRIAAAPFPVAFAGETAERIPLPDGSVDAAVSTWTLCTIPDVVRALSEVRRLLRPGGVFRFVEHGRSHEPGVARWQDRLTPFQKAVAGGCHLNRRIDRLLLLAGFHVTGLETFYVPGPRVGTFLYTGAAVPRLSLSSASRSSRSAP